MAALSVDTRGAFRCSNCASTAFSAIRPYLGDAPGFTGKTLVRCLGCRLVAVHPLPTDAELESFYDSYWKDRVDIKQLDKLAERANARARFLNPYLPARDPLRVLDVGAGFGHIYGGLAALRRGRRVEYDAVEVDPDAVRYLNDTLTARAVRSRIEDFPGPYDLMVMSHFLEHLPDPVEYLRAQAPRLTRGGLLFAEVPNADYRFKSHHQPHLSFFEIDTLARVVETTGFEVVRIDTCGALVSDIALANARRARQKEQRERSLWRRAAYTLRKTIRLRSREKSRAKPDPHVESYGGDRRWIRVIAARPVR